MNLWLFQIRIYRFQYRLICAIVWSSTSFVTVTIEDRDWPVIILKTWFLPKWIFNYFPHLLSHVQLWATINVLPHFSTNIPFYIKWRKKLLHSPLIISFNQFTIWANKTGPRTFTLLHSIQLQNEFLFDSGH